MRVDTPNRRRRLWSENVPIDRLLEGALLSSLAERKIQLLLAVQPGGLEGALAVLERAPSMGLSMGLWPLLHDDEGRWLNKHNGPRFESWTLELLDGVENAGLSFDTLALDLEPPIDRIKRLLAPFSKTGPKSHRQPRESASWAGVHRRLLHHARSRGIETLAAVLAPTLLPGVAGMGWQRALGTPVTAMGYERISPMLYTSLVEGYSHRLLDRKDAQALLLRSARDLKSAYGPRASISLGTVGGGALGDERPYRGPEELAQDVAMARAAGIDDLALFDLGGLLSRAPIERWLDVFCEENPQELEGGGARLRAQAVLALLWSTGIALALWQRT